MNANQIKEMRENVVARLEEMMARGERPWHRGFSTTNMGMPTSVGSKKPYRGGNAVVLDLTAMSEGWDSKWWGTFKSWKGVDFVPKRGSKATWILYFDRRKVEKEVDGEVEEKTFSVARAFPLFNAHQLVPLSDGDENTWIPKEKEVDEADKSKTVDEIVKRHKIAVRHQGDQPAYNPLTDRITMPKMGYFDEATAYYGTLAHEMIHWAYRRTNEKAKLGKFGDEDYAREELVAEIGAAYFLREIGIPIVKVEYMDQNSAAYLKGWMKAIKADPKTLFTAATEASKAVDFLIGRKEEEDSE